MVTTLMIPVRVGPRNESLRYALRAWQRAEQWIGPVEVYVIGGKPQWYKGNHLPTLQRQDIHAQWTINFPRAMKAAIDAGVGEFIWTADDIFPIDLSSMAGRGVETPIEPSLPWESKAEPQVTVSAPSFVIEWPTYCRILDLDDYVAKWYRVKALDSYTRRFVDGMAGQIKILRELGVMTQHNADIHLPHLMSSDHLSELLQILERRFPLHPAGHFRAIYGGLWPSNVRRVRDPKVVGLHAQPTGRLEDNTEWVSTSGSSWRGKTGHMLRELLTEPSRWE